MSRKSSRQRRILDALEINPAMRVKALAAELDVSAETVRRDLAELADGGRLRRTYGGAVRTGGFEPALAERLKLHVAERERIARRALERLGDVESVFVGGGATTLHFARALRLLERRLTVLTPALGVATEASANPRLEVLLLPGIVEPSEGLVHGGETLQAISRFHSPLAVVGASALDESGVSDALLSAAQVYAAMIDRAARTFVLADRSKFGGQSLRRVLDWREGVCLICDAAPEDSLAEAVRAAGAEIDVVE